MFALLITALGLDGSGTGAAVVTVIALLLGFFGAGGVAGAMAVRGGLIHGFLSWATALLATMLLLVLITLGAAGAAGAVLGSLVGGLTSAAGPAITSGQLPAGVPTPSPAQTQQAQQDAQQAAAQAAQATKTGAAWGFVGLLLGAMVVSSGWPVGLPFRSQQAHHRLQRQPPEAPLPAESALPVTRPQVRLGWRLSGGQHEACDSLGGG